MCSGLIPVLSRMCCSTNALIYSQSLTKCFMGTSRACEFESVVMCVGMVFIYFCVCWLSLRSWVCRGQPAVCCWGWATQRCQGKQISVGAAAARPEAVHGENDASPWLCLSSTPSQKGFVLSSSWDVGLITCLQCACCQCPSAHSPLTSSSSRHSLVSTLIQSAAEQRVTVERSAYPEFRWVFICHLYSMAPEALSHICTSLNFLTQNSVSDRLHCFLWVMYVLGTRLTPQIVHGSILIRWVVFEHERDWQIRGAGRKNRRTNNGF